MLRNLSLSIHVTLQNVRYFDRSIACLVVLHYRHDSALSSDESTVQRVHVFGRKAGLLPVPDL